jgi:hypothetical protein
MVEDSNCGGHPWEICRGGNSTHISLYLCQIENGWMVRLAGSSNARVVETVKMAIAFYLNNIPFVLEEAEGIFRMITGVDYIGILPETIIPAYCHGFFPAKDRIIDFMNLSFEKVDKIVENSYWYPVKEVWLIKNKLDDIKKEKIREEIMKASKDPLFLADIKEIEEDFKYADFD